jgi:hypothetical protein
MFYLLIISFIFLTAMNKIKRTSRISQKNLNYGLIFKALNGNLFNPRKAQFKDSSLTNTCKKMLNLLKLNYSLTNHRNDN